MREPDADPNAVACQTCQTIDDSVAERRTSSGNRPLCSPCYADVLSATRLSPREAEVYAYADADYSNEETAARLEIDASTVANHLATVRRKFMEAAQLTDLLDPASATSDQHAREFENEPPRGLEPGVVVELDEPSVPVNEPSMEYTHGIVRRVLTRSNTGIPTRISVYPFDPTEGAIRTSQSRGVPEVIDTHAEYVTVVFPTHARLVDLPTGP